jgi:hypothetical protein
VEKKKEEKKMREREREGEKGKEGDRTHFEKSCYATRSRTFNHFIVCQ